MKLFPVRMDASARVFYFREPIDFLRLNVFKNGVLLNPRPQGNRMPDWGPVGDRAVGIRFPFNEVDDAFQFQILGV